MNTLTPAQEIAYSITNGIGVADNYPTLYQAAYQIIYKGRLTNSVRKNVEKLQSLDARKFNYVPEELLEKLKSII
jgi:hypothetical protein